MKVIVKEDAMSLERIERLAKVLYEEFGLLSEKPLRIGILSNNYNITFTDNPNNHLHKIMKKCKELKYVFEQNKVMVEKK